MLRYLNLRFLWGPLSFFMISGSIYEVSLLFDGFSGKVSPLQSIVLIGESTKNVFEALLEGFTIHVSNGGGKGNIFRTNTNAVLCITT